MKTRGKNRKIHFEQVYAWDNLKQADREARRGKKNNYGVRKWDEDAENNLRILQEELRTRTYHTSAPHFEERFCDRKARVLAKVHYRDHLAHHALMQVILPVLDKSIYYESSASIKNRGIHYSAKHVRKYIDMHSRETLWWVQMDFTKFYHHINRERLYEKVCRMFDDDGIRYMLKDIIWSLGNHNGLKPSDGSEGLGIGEYPVQTLANFYMNDFDRAISAIDGVKMYRYCDNILLISNDTRRLQYAIDEVLRWAKDILCQPLHHNYGIQKLDEVHPIDFVGYMFYPTHTYIRKRMKYTFKRKYIHTEGEAQRRVLASYKGWLQKANGLTLWKKVTNMKRFSELNIKRGESTRNGQRFFDVPAVSAKFLVNRELVVKDFIENVSTVNGNDRMCILVEENGEDKKFLTNNPRLKDIMLQVREQEELPFKAMFRSRNLGSGKIDYYFE